MAKTKLHELLAADTTAKGQSDKCRSDLLTTFDKKKHHFSEKVVTFTPNVEGAVAITEEQLDIQTTIRKELDWIKGIWSRSIDVDYQIAESNTVARADVILDNGETILANVPATSLLELEKRMGEAHALVMGIPTLDPAKGFKPDPDRGVGIYKAREELKTRTKKVSKVVVLYPHTEQHPAQTQLVPEDIATGTIRSQEWSALITPAEKADMLNRVEELRRAIKQARARANEAEASTLKAGNTLLSYAFGN